MALEDRFSVLYGFRPSRGPQFSVSDGQVRSRTKGRMMLERYEDEPGKYSVFREPMSPSDAARLSL